MPSSIGRARLLRRLLPALAATVATIGVADAGLVVRRYGLDYLYRLITWRRAAPGDWNRFPARAIRGSGQVLRLPAVVGGATMVQGAFADSLAALGQPRQAMGSLLVEDGTTSFLVLGKSGLLYEGYFAGRQRESIVESFSMAKAITSLLTGIAIGEGLIASVSTPVGDLLPELPWLRGSDLQVIHLLQMTSGFRWDDARPLGPLSHPWTDTSVMAFSTDLRRDMRDIRPAVPPGSRFLYDDRNAMLLGMILEKVTGGTVSAYLERRLWQPMGAEFDASWSLDREGGFEKMETGVNARPLDLLKLGALVLRGGRGADGRAIVPQDWIDAMHGPGEPVPATDPVVGPRSYHRMWWAPGGAAGSGILYAEGVYGQYLFVDPESGVVILRTGDRDASLWPALLQGMAQRLA